MLLDPLKPIVGHADHADIGLDGAERIVRRLNARCGEGVEERALADIGETDDSCFHSVSRGVRTGSEGGGW